MNCWSRWKVRDAHARATRGPAKVGPSMIEADRQQWLVLRWSPTGYNRSLYATCCGSCVARDRFGRADWRWPEHTPNSGGSGGWTNVPGGDRYEGLPGDVQAGSEGALR